MERERHEFKRAAHRLEEDDSWWHGNREKNASGVVYIIGRIRHSSYGGAAGWKLLGD